jgi:hypothetical protein
MVTTREANQSGNVEQWGGRTMNIAFDHLVHFVKDDPVHAVELVKQHGFHAVAGGRHEAWGTYNGLCYFDLSYIEFLAVENPIVARQATDNDLIRQALRELAVAEGLGRVAIRTDDIRQLAEYMRKQGLAVTGPLPGSRTRADGSVIKWSLLFPEYDAGKLPLPFFIEWEQPDEQRRLDLQNRQVIAPHPAGELRLSYVAFAVSELEQTVNAWKNCLGLVTGEVFTDSELNARCQEILLPGGNLRFCSPLGSGLVADVLQTRGECPFLVSISGAKRRADLQILGSIYQLQI